MLATLALDFVFFHEIGHLALGHVGWGSSRGATRHLEVEAATSAFEFAHTRELGADGFAARVTRQEMLGGPADWSGTPFRSRDDAIRCRESSVACLSWLMGERSQRAAVAAYDGSLHPHPAVRLRNVLDVSLRLGRESTSGTNESVRRGWTKAVESLELFRTRFGMASTVAAGRLFDGDEVEIRLRKSIATASALHSLPAPLRLLDPAVQEATLVVPIAPRAAKTHR